MSDTLQLVVELPNTQAHRKISTKRGAVRKGASGKFTQVTIDFNERAPASAFLRD